mmetsp:Transcript_5325/g.11547  ORF Transcript_5325/g.11547 Transcript_5325/m.11547 type:complete len:183 (+) Transcript_5325:496-1044(+)
MLISRGRAGAPREKQAPTEALRDRPRNDDRDDRGQPAASKNERHADNGYRPRTRTVFLPFTIRQGSSDPDQTRASSQQHSRGKANVPELVILQQRSQCHGTARETAHQHPGGTRRAFPKGDSWAGQTSEYEEEADSGMATSKGGNGNATSKGTQRLEPGGGGMMERTTKGAGGRGGAPQRVG